MQRRIICFYSGGIKSVASLMALLLEEKFKDYIIQVHYINIVNYKKEFQLAARAVEKSLTAFSKFTERKFLISENQINFSCLPFSSKLPADIDICGFVASQMVAVDPSIRYIVMGLSSADLAKTGSSASLDKLDAYLAMAKEQPEASADVEYFFPLMDLEQSSISALAAKLVSD